MVPFPKVVKSYIGKLHCKEKHIGLVVSKIQYTSASTNQRNCRCRRFSFIKTNIIIFFREGKKITEATYGKEYKIQAEMDKPSRKIFLLVAKLLFNSKCS